MSLLARWAGGIDGAVELARRMPAGPPVTLVFADKHYSDVLLNWLKRARAVGASNILVLALDRSTARLARECGAVASVMSVDRGRSALWRLRVEVFAAFGHAGIPFIHSDADAIWLRSPYAAALATDADLAFSQGTVWPHDIARLWGFVLCCGFFAARSGPHMAGFLDCVARHVRAEADDQVAFNRALREAKINWRGVDDGVERRWENRSFRIFPSPVMGRTIDGLSVALLPHRQFARLPEIGEGTIVAHPLSTERSARHRLVQFGLWDVAA